MPRSHTLPLPPVSPEHPAALLQCELDRAGVLLDLDPEGVEDRWRAFCVKADRLVQRNAGQIQRSYLMSWMAYFADPREALRAAWGLHEKVRSANRNIPAEQQFHLRIGVHSVDRPWHALAGRDPVLVQLAELTALAAADETVVDPLLRDQLVDDLDARIEDLGDCLSKRSAEQIRVFRTEQTEAPGTGQVPRALADDAPSLAVIPFRWEGGDGDFAAVGDLLADRLIDQLSLSHHVQMISRLTGAAFRGRDRDTQLIQSHLQARYVLTGHYRVIGNSLQGTLEVGARLTDALTGEVLWADGEVRGSVGELLSAASELVHRLATDAHHAVVDAQVRALAQQPLASLSQYALMLGGITLMHRAAPGAFQTSRQALDELLQRDPDLLVAHAWLAKWYVLRVTRGLTRAPADDAEQALAHARQAQQAPGALALGLAMQGFVTLHLRRDFAAALTLIEQACQHNPSEPLAWLFGGVAHSFLNQPAEAMVASQRALALSPLDPLLYYFESLAASSAIVAGQHEEAIALCQRSLRRNLTHLHSHRALVTALWSAGQTGQARAAAERLLRLQPGYTVAAFRQTAASADTDFGRQMAAALQAAGVPPG